MGLGILLLKGFLLVDDLQNLGVPLFIKFLNPLDLLGGLPVGNFVGKLAVLINHMHSDWARDVLLVLMVRKDTRVPSLIN